jgi:hypothetical protein
MTASRPSYAPTSPRRSLPATERLRLRVHQRARRDWPVQALLDDRQKILGALEALERARATVATELEKHAAQTPAVREDLERSTAKAAAKLAIYTERVRHRLLLDDGLLNAHGVRPWEQVGDSPPAQA